MPHFEYGTTLRMYNPATRTWEIAYGYTGRIMRFEARKQEDRIVLSSLEDEHRKWVFAKIAENHFHWQDIMVQQDGEWQVNYDLYAKRMDAARSREKSFLIMKSQVVYETVSRYA